jgi:hypothetical protein
MTLHRASAPRPLTLVAATGDRFSDFSPYVASINNAGVVAFQATLRAGGMGVFTGDGGPISTVADTANGPWATSSATPTSTRTGG